MNDGKLSAVLTCGSCNMIGSLGAESLVLFFLFLRLVFGVVATLARFLPNTVVKVVEVADIPMVVVVVALGGSMGTSFSDRQQGSSLDTNPRLFAFLRDVTDSEGKKGQRLLPSAESSFCSCISEDSSLVFCPSSSSCFLFCSSFFFLRFSFLFSLLAASACFLLSSRDC